MIDLYVPFNANAKFSGNVRDLFGENGYICPYRHEMLATTTYVEENAFHCLINEKIRDLPREGPPTRVEDLFEILFNWPLDAQMVSVYRNSDGLSVEFLSGRIRTSPLYIVWTPESIRASWDITTLITKEIADNIDVPPLCAEISLENCYTSRTIVKNVFRLLERTHVHGNRRGIKLCEPSSGTIFTPKKLAENADPVSAYARLLQLALTRPAWPVERTAFELSGGLDSASLVAISSDSSLPARFTSGTLLPGETGERQRKRRDEVRHLLPNSQDVTIQGAEALLGSDLDRAFCQVPFENPNSPVGFALLKKLRMEGITTIITGIGGDELFSLHPWEQDAFAIPQPKPLPYLLYSPKHDGCFLSAEDTAPFPTVAASALLAACNRAPMFMREGVWLINPLCSAELTQFAQQLPLEWRNNRRLPRDLLGRWGLTIFSDPYPSETYDELNILNIRQHQEQIRTLFQASCLAEAGIIDRFELMRCFECWLNDASSLRYDYFHALISLELFFQRQI